MEANGIMEDVIDEMTITITPDSEMEQTHTETDRDETICTNPRRDLTQTIQQLDPNFVEAVLPL